MVSCNTAFSENFLVKLEVLSLAPPGRGVLAQKLGAAYEICTNSSYAGYLPSQQC